MRRPWRRVGESERFGCFRSGGCCHNVERGQVESANMRGVRVEP
ncbi:MAG: hypothetical protein QOJ61_3515 [Mycobacterium sp.]|jgi:hypothetical protein|nr:hypothetical protein [Mycobacterium sp.]